MARHWTFRKELVLVPLACVGAAWFLSGVDSAYAWYEILDWLRVRDHERYTRLFLLGTSLITGLLIYKLVHKGDKE